jgi:RHS repeat-associated protein
MTYTLDLNAGLTQVLTDGETTYLYGLARLAQLDTGTLDTAYFLGDVLGSVRQLTDETGVVTYAASYTPYGEVLSSVGEGESVYGFTGEYSDVTGLVYLRARYYSPMSGRFLSRDIWGGDTNSPMSYNMWLYVFGNPVNFTDPKGLYGEAVHVTLTRYLVRQAMKGNPAVAYNPILHSLISSWDYYVDWGPTVNSVTCGPCHFMSYDRTMQHIEAAIRSGEPYIFGAVLHQVQD